MWEEEAFFLQKKNLIKNPAAFLLKAEADHHTRMLKSELRRESRKKKEKQQQWLPSYAVGNACLEELHENIQT